ncbi:MAG TPA: alpha/beta fold hydrolase [Paenibacillus sp.]|uniref:alpha/beta hydrolase n=1 Tax=Paenibacillus sp. TaxID=58172 RepID=UPI002CA3FAF0|nr:alpha/beta fold hydrolase [Paenibacillus sp.]HUC92150.1 alpha/beta fold hydrolase [Paenibacillus sp.]
MIGWIAGGAGVCLAALAGFWKAAANSQRPRLLPNEASPEAVYENVTFRSGNETLRGWLLQPANERENPWPTVIIAHGWGSNRSRVLRYTKPLMEAGYAVFMFDARSHGDSDAVAAPSGFMFRDDVEAAVAAASRQPGVDPTRIAVLGHSLGGFGALLAYGRGLPVKAVVTDSSPLRFETMIRSELKRRKLPFFPLGILIPKVWLARAHISRKEAKSTDVPAWIRRNHEGERRPLFMVHSLRDGYVDPGDLRAVTEQVPIEHLFVNAPGHSCSETDPDFWPAVLSFMRKHL